MSIYQPGYTKIGGQIYELQVFLLEYIVANLDIALLLTLKKHISNPDA